MGRGTDKFERNLKISLASILGATAIAYGVFRTNLGKEYVTEPVKQYFSEKIEAFRTFREEYSPSHILNSLFSPRE